MATVTTRESEVSQLKEQIAGLTEQVAALTMQKKEKTPLRCFSCIQLGYIQRNCPKRQRECQCFQCGRWGHTARQCWQGNGRGMSVRGHGQQISPAVNGPQHTITVATTSHAAVISGKVGGKSVEIMLDSGFSISLLTQNLVPELHDVLPMELPPIQLKTASGEPLPIIDCICTQVCVANMESPVQQKFIVVSHLINQSSNIGSGFLPATWFDPRFQWC